MTLNLLSSLASGGRNGQTGALGSFGNAVNPNGGAGGDGTAGGLGRLSVQAQTYAGDAGNDQISLARTTSGGTGGAGGLGGSGANADPGTTTSSGHGFFRTDVVFDAAGAGGAGGLAGKAGKALSLFSRLDFVLGASTLGDTVQLTAAATGGNGGVGGSGGRGGGSIGGSGTASYTTQGFLNITNTIGAPAGLVEDGRNGAAGALGRSAMNDLGFAGDRLVLSLVATATGGNGGAGGVGGTGNDGATGTEGGDGGAGGAGGASVASIIGLDVAAATSLTLQVNLTARGGTGGAGGNAGNGSAGILTNTQFIDGEGSTLTQFTHVGPGDGGRGGGGGGATARLADATVTGGTGADFVALRLLATGGAGGAGGTGGRGVESSVTEVETTVIEVFGVAPGLPGLSGSAGAALAEMRNVAVQLGDGNDTLLISLAASGPGARIVTFAGNSLDGGLGATDTLRLGDGVAGEARAVVNLRDGTLQIGSGGVNIISGFEVFRGGTGDDLFVDGAGNQTYEGLTGADRFVFRAGQAGADRIEAFAADDVISLRGFGQRLDSLAEVLAAAADTGLGVRIQTSATSSILLAGLTEASLTADDFRF